MSILLSKGQELELKKEVPTLHKIRIGIGWSSEVLYHGKVKTIRNINYDSFAFMLIKGKIPNKRYMSWYWNKNTSGIEGECLRHHGDNPTKNTSPRRYKERLDIFFDKVPSEVDEILVGMNGPFRALTYAFMRASDLDTQQEIFNYELYADESLKKVSTLGIGLFIRQSDNTWKFKLSILPYKSWTIPGFKRAINNGKLRL